MINRIFLILIVITLGLWLFVRFAPQTVAQWHRLPNVEGPGDTSTTGGFLAVRKMTVPRQEVLAALDSVAGATPRTDVMAGSIAEGLITYQTRSKLWGFPDHTTIGTQGDLLIIHGRLRFGQSDLGVNKARIQAWLVALGPLTEPL
ncbi:DUF1499 domain-containing protein [Loktanella sp. Alg231-35]|uniref:DUF1499 domain-containing protein n=1 Tax=Loktanella sp. Alg231-35 TaxID=1922220 RepID=UPI000D552B2D|nr:DUF1499 domain-containing protein [Loktanella sp. Alg231-35]